MLLGVREYIDERWDVSVKEGSLKKGGVERKKKTE